GVIAAPAAHARGLAPARPAPDRGLALVLCRPGHPGRGQEFPPRVLYPLFRPGRDDRAGRHGELELRPCREPRYNRPPPPLLLPLGLGCAVEDYRGGVLRIPGRVTDITQARSRERPMRTLSRRWAQFMEADSWAELASWRRADTAAAALRPTGT